MSRRIGKPPNVSREAGSDGVRRQVDDVFVQVCLSLGLVTSSLNARSVIDFIGLQDLIAYSAKPGWAGVKAKTRKGSKAMQHSKTARAHSRSKMTTRLMAGAALSVLCGAMIDVGVSRAEITSAAPATEQVETVVVTAQRREQKLQDVGIAVTAITGGQLKALGLKDSTDLTKDVPGLKMNEYTPSAVVFNIRGVSQNDFGDEQEPPVAVYQDDSYSSSFISSGFPMFDLARVEVLRGPQGTLFGRNATGGAIQFISAKPSHDFNGFVTVGTGSWQDRNIEAAINLPISDKIQTRLSGMQDNSDGYIKELDSNFPNRGAANHWALRDITDWEPNDTTKVELNVRFARNPHEHSAGMYSWEAAYANSNNQGVYLPANMVNPNSNGVSAPAGLPPGADFYGYNNSAIDYQRGGNPFLVGTQGPSYTDRSLFAANLKIDSEVGAFHVTSITDVQDNTKHYLEDASASPSGWVTFAQGGNVRQYSEELRTSGHFGQHELVMGAFAMSVDGHYTASYALPSGFDGDYVPNVTFSQLTKSYAIFAQDEWTLPNNFKAILGARYWSDERQVNYNAFDTYGEGVIFNTHQVYAYNWSTGAQVTQGITVKPSDADKTFSDYSLRAELDYKPTKDILTYASFNRGTKSGGFTLSTATPTAGTEASFLNGIPYKPEVLNAYEIGVKSTLPLRSTLNLTAFYYDYQNYQAFTYYGQVEVVVNKQAWEQGFEAEFATHPLPGLTLSGNAAFMNNQVTGVALPIPDPGIPLVNRHLPQAPKEAFQGLARYEHPILSGFGALQWDTEYTGATCFSVLCAPIEREPSHVISNIRVSYQPASKQWEAAFALNNAFNEIYRVYTYDASPFSGQIPSVYGKPQNWAVTLTYHF